MIIHALRILLACAAFWYWTALVAVVAFFAGFLTIGLAHGDGCECSPCRRERWERGEDPGLIGYQYRFTALGQWGGAPIDLPGFEAAFGLACDADTHRFMPPFKLGERCHCGTHAAAWTLRRANGSGQVLASLPVAHAHAEARG